MNSVQLCAVVIIVPSFAGCDSVQPQRHPRLLEMQARLDSHFENVVGTFVLCDLKHDVYLRHNQARAAERFSPCSTFKIPNSLIGLETGVLQDAEFEINRDSSKYSRRRDLTHSAFNEWWQDQTLRTAFRRSVVWYYRELALRIGEARMKEFLSRLSYGNQDMSAGLDRFWLSGSLSISADEQIEFLMALYQERLPVSRRSMAIVKDILAMEQTVDYKLSGKTDSGLIEPGRWIGWFIGWIETQDKIPLFATQIEGPTFDTVVDERKNLTKRILFDLGYM